MLPEVFFAYITCKDADDARRIGKALVTERLAACANILPGMESHYWWNGKVESSREAVLIAKTRGEARDALLERVLDLHPYETPCVVFLPVSGGNPGYLDWIARESESP
ncbi:MAG TPA: divalent-cation tolerance protein CutA [Fibrobacteria bacterium]|jgi:periplasmic divalent cation tolerance protein|nr:divalent-cation tolerance protein CutA [Fibrobacteria bacterium]